MRRSQLPIKRGQVAGLAFYESSDIENGSLPVVRLRHAGQILEFPISRSVLMTADEGRHHAIEDIEASLKMPDAPASRSNTASMAAYERHVYELITETIRRINTAGWGRFIDPSKARLVGWDSYRAETEASPDPTYPFTFQPWSQIYLKDNANWEWFSGNAFIRLTFRPGRSSTSISDVLSVNIESKRVALLPFDPKGDGDAVAAVQELRRILPKLVAQRRDREVKARALGYHVLAEWKDPPFGGGPVPEI